MSTIADALELLIKQIISNIDTLTLRRIRTKARGDLTLDNGAGASIVLAGDKVLINGLSGDGNSSDIIYLGKDKKCWICRDLVTGDLVFHTPKGNGFVFEDARQASSLTATDSSYVNYQYKDTNFVSSGYLLVDSDFNDSVIQFPKFSAIKKPVASAKLRLYSMVTQGGSTTFQLSFILGTFNQSTVTDRNLPARRSLGHNEISLLNSGSPGWVEFDITSFINDPDNGQTGDTCGIYLNYVSGTNLKFGSVSGGYAPILVIAEVSE